MNNYLVKSL